MSPSSKTLYVYDPSTKEVLYTVDNPHPRQLSKLENDGVCGYLGEPGQSTLNSYVSIDVETNEPIGIYKLNQFPDEVVLSDTKVVANGTHSVTITGIEPDMSVCIHCNNPEKSIILFEGKYGNDSATIIAHDYLIFPEKNEIRYTIHQTGRKPRDCCMPVV